MAVFAPTPSATVKIAMAVKPGFLASPRKAYLRSWIMVFIGVWGSGATGVPYRRCCGDWLFVDAASAGVLVFRKTSRGNEQVVWGRGLGTRFQSRAASLESPAPCIKESLHLQPLRTDGAARSERSLVGRRSRLAGRHRSWPRGLSIGARGDAYPQLTDC